MTNTRSFSGTPIRRVGIFLAAMSMTGGTGAACLAPDNEKLSRALGVLFAHQVLGGYKDVIDTKAVAEGMDIALGRVPESHDGQSDAGAGSDGPEPVRTGTTVADFPVTQGSDYLRSNSGAEIEAAEQAVREWHRRSLGIDERFLASFVGWEGAKKTASILYRSVPVAMEEALAQAWSDTPLSGGVGDSLGCDVAVAATNGTRRVCYRFRTVTEMDICRDDEESRNAWISGWAGIPPVTDDIQTGNVIEGWRDLFELVEDGKVNSASHLIELVVPAAFGYGEKGIPGKVGPGQTLWFLIRFASGKDE